MEEMETGKDKKERYRRKQEHGRIQVWQKKRKEKGGEGTEEI